MRKMPRVLIPEGAAKAKHAGASVRQVVFAIAACMLGCGSSVADADTADTCIDSNSSADGGYWFEVLTAFIQQYGLDWTYWPLNGTHSTGGSSAYGSAETYRILNARWSGISNAELTSRMQSIMSSTPPGM